MRQPCETEKAISNGLLPEGGGGTLLRNRDTPRACPTHPYRVERPCRGLCPLPSCEPPPCRTWARASSRPSRRRPRPWFCRGCSAYARDPPSIHPRPPPYPLTPPRQTARFPLSEATRTAILRQRAHVLEWRRSGNWPGGPDIVGQRKAPACTQSDSVCAAWR